MYMYEGGCDVLYMLHAPSNVLLPIINKSVRFVAKQLHCTCMYAIQPYGGGNQGMLSS